MTPEKKAIAHNDYFAFYIGRPISYVITVPFLYIPIKPNTISLLSVIPLILCVIAVMIENNVSSLYFGWCMLFVWNILDGVDGNVARYRKQFTKLGSVYDAMSGYVAMIVTFMFAGIAAAHSSASTSEYREALIILGSLSGIFMIFPRLIMHKVISTTGDNSSVSSVKAKEEFDMIKTIALNISSVSGGAQVLLLLAIIFNMLESYTIIYFVINTTLVYRIYAA